MFKWIQEVGDDLIVFVVDLLLQSQHPTMFSGHSSYDQ